MDSRADFDAKEQVRQATDILNVVGGYLELRRQGRHFVAQCPWHDDRKPSLTVNQERQSWKCWVCNVGGDVFSFVMKKENIDFREALELLAERAGIQLTRSQPAEAGSPHDKKTLFAALQWCESNFRECLLNADVAAPARKYLEERGISRESIDQFKIGFSPNEWQWLADRARFTAFTPEVLEACGMLARGSQSGKLFDFFRGRITFPIHDLQNRTVAFGARVLPEFAEQLRGKYINTSETKLFSKSEHLYGLAQAREEVARSRNITVVEGYTDVIMAHQFGVRNVVAVLGTALNARHIQHLKRFADCITLVLDGDEAGQRRTNEILELFVAAQVDLRVVTLPEQYDPCELFLERGVDFWNEVMLTAVDALEHKMRLATRGIDMLHDSHRANQALEDVLSTLARAPADVFRSSDGLRLRQQQMLTRIAREFQIPEDELRERWRGLRDKFSSNQKTTAVSKPTTTSATDNSVADAERPTITYSGPIVLDPREKELFELLVAHPTLAITALQELGTDDLITSAGRDLFAVYRTLEETGSDLEFPHVLSALPHEALQTLLVEIDERAARKEQKALQEPAARLRAVIDKFRLGQRQREQREQVAVLEERRLDTADEGAILQQMAELHRRRMGIHLN